MSDIVERLRAHKADIWDWNGAAMTAWDGWRSAIAKGDKSSWPRDAFESLIGGYGEDMGDAADEIEALRAEVEKLRAEVQTWQGHAKTAIWSDSEECKLLTRINAALLEAPTVDVEVVVPDRDYAKMTPKDCYEAGLLDGVHQAREAIKAAAIRALKENSNE